MSCGQCELNCLIWAYKGIQRGLGARGFNLTPFNSKFHFHGKYLIQSINLGYRPYSIYSQSLSLYLIIFSNKSILLSMNLCKIAG